MLWRGVGEPRGAGRVPGVLGLSASEERADTGSGQQTGRTGVRRRFAAPRCCVALRGGGGGAVVYLRVPACPAARRRPALPVQHRRISQRLAQPLCCEVGARGVSRRCWPASRSRAATGEPRSRPRCYAGVKREGAPRVK